MLKIAANRGLNIPTKKMPRIVKITLNNTDGYVKFTNGTQLDFDVSTLALLRRYKCEDEVEICSNDASKRFTSALGVANGVWDEMLMETSVINFYGKWNPDALVFILARTSQLTNISFTYWQCDDPARVLDAIKSNGIRELSMHVQKDRQMSVMDEVKRLCERTKLRRLILVFEISFKRNIVSEFQAKLSNVLASGAQIMLLFGGENDCIKSLEQHGYTLDRHIRMATNELYERRSNKTYETYEVYQNNRYNATWLVGSRIGWCVPPLSQQPRPYKTIVENAYLPVGDQVLRWDTINTGLLPKPEHEALKVKKEYGPHEKVDSTEICCKLTELPFGLMRGLKKWNIPGWTDTKIQKLIYNDNLTEFLTSNGFYIVLDKMDDEADFFATIATTSRFEFICSTSRRRFVVTENLDLFLADVYHIEFTGVWYSKIIEEIAAKFITRMYALTLMQVELHGNRPLIEIFNQMSDRVKQNIKVFHFDARTAKDRSVGSIMNAFWKKTMKFEELIIISNQWADLPWAKPPNYKFKLFKHVEDCSGWRFEPNAGWFPGPNSGWLLEPNGSATTMVVENLSSMNYLCFPFYARLFPVMAPIAYPNRDTVNGLTRLMDGYYREFKISEEDDSRHFYIVIPKGSSYKNTRF